MYIVPMSGISVLPSIDSASTAKNDVKDNSTVSFLDVFENIVNNAVETSAQVDKDAVDLMLGDVDDLSQIQVNLEKAATAIDLLVTVKNKAVDAYNEIVKMNI